MFAYDEKRLLRAWLFAAALLAPPAAVAGCGEIIGLGDGVHVETDAASDGYASADGAPDTGSADSAPDTGFAPEAGRDAGPAFSLALDTWGVSIVQGSFATVGVTVVPTGGFSGTVAVSELALPSGVTADSLTIGPSLQGTLTLRADASAPLATVGVATVTGIYGALSSPGVPLSVVVQGPRGAPDPSFGTNGVATIPIGSAAAVAAHGLGIDSENRPTFCGNDQAGRVVMAGRLDEDGSLDTTFGNQGFYHSSDGACQKVIPLDGGGIALGGFLSPIAGGTSYPQNAMFASLLTASGQADPSFSGTGTAVIYQTSTTGEEAFDLTIRSDGRWLLGGFVPYGTPALVSLLPNGTPDYSFDPKALSGISARAFQDAGGGAYPTFVSLGLLPNGDAVGSVQANDFTLLGVGLDGALDPAYGTNGVATTAVPGLLMTGTGWISVAVRRDGSTLCSGNTSATIEITRFTVTGQTDTPFGQSGRTSTPMAGTGVYSMAETFEGGAAVGVLTGGTGNPATQIGIVRYDAKGALDTAFNGTGSSLIAAPNAVVAATAVDSVGRIVIAAATGSNVTLARFWP